MTTTLERNIMQTVKNTITDLAFATALVLSVYSLTTLAIDWIEEIWY